MTTAAASAERSTPAGELMRSATYWKSAMLISGGERRLPGYSERLLAEEVGPVDGTAALAAAG